MNAPDAPGRSVPLTNTAVVGPPAGRLPAVGALPPARAVTVDLQRGSGDDSGGLLGLAALAARALMDTRQRSGPGALARDNAWQTRHRLERRRSSFSFWSALDDGLDDVAASFTASPVPDGDRFAALVRGQSRLVAAYESNQFTQVARLLEVCAWGSADQPLGTARTVASLRPSHVADYLTLCREDGFLFHSASSDAERTGRRAPAPAPVAPPWRGASLVLPWSTATTRVAVAVPVEASAPGAVELAVEILGSHGLGGRIGPALRGDRALAYGLSAFHLSRGGSRALAAQAQVSPGNVPEASRLLLETIHGVLAGPVPEPERRAAASRVRTALLLQVDQPFGTVDELRRTACGEATLVETAAAVELRADDGILPVRRDERPATAIVGAAPSGSGGLVESTEP
ncbi:insulinase family protein [Streptomyces anulatus]|uniref:insulinase family protein n=1 Tax=Streptomyces anulatus TaxID=1892 RepID=UPI0030E35F1D